MSLAWVFKGLSRKIQSCAASRGSIGKACRVLFGYTSPPARRSRRGPQYKDLHDSSTRRYMRKFCADRMRRCLRSPAHRARAEANGAAFDCAGVAPRPSGRAAAVAAKRRGRGRAHEREHRARCGRYLPYRCGKNRALQSGCTQKFHRCARFRRRVEPRLQGRRNRPWIVFAALKTSNPQEYAQKIGEACPALTRGIDESTAGQ